MTKESMRELVGLAVGVEVAEVVACRNGIAGRLTFLIQQSHAAI